MFGWKAAGLAMVAAGCLLAIACGGGGEGSEATPTGISVVVVTPSGAATPRTRRTQTPTPVMTATPLQVCGPNPDPVTPALLQVQEPAGQAQVRIPFHVRGWVSRGIPVTTTPVPTEAPTPVPVPEGQTPQTPAPTPGPTPLDLRGVTLALVDQKQNVVQTNVLPLSPRDFRIAPPGLQITDTTRPFAADVVLKDINEPTPFCLWVFLDTTPDGKARGVLQIPVVVLPQ